MNSASGLPPEIVFGIVIAVALWSVVLWIAFKKQILVRVKMLL